MNRLNIRGDYQQGLYPLPILFPHPHPSELKRPKPKNKNKYGQKRTTSRRTIAKKPKRKPPTMHQRLASRNIRGDYQQGLYPLPLY